MTMHTYWQVREVTEKPGTVMAELAPVEWFKKNPEYDAHADEVGWDGEEFIEAQPGEEGAEYIDAGGPLIRLDITEGPELHPMDNVAMAMSVLATVDA